ncbi:DUF3943 domain-containing protein [Mucilaginibacter aquariorum]|uniref:DUF3943 domain-containing protein n=1 Tax=Mucilaginibacter aquariorum TaxID=2967225 RepID=A0ABT1T2A3_9SPHI|nr:DUF3943 domain-containing protein [Mucilaginibacter aquariorum]MCQ6958719.1 DUF3943 domain-containing protein [Mucilaginibacter aquariorum]
MPRLYYLSFWLLTCFAVQGQPRSAALSPAAGTAVTDTPPPRRFGRAAFQLALGELIPWTVDRYVRNVDYARISFRTIGHNLQPSSWTWDDDAFGTNQFAHPYHGSLYFSAFRSNGYTFWQSAPPTLAGSYVWETMAEKQYPSPNDFINTSFGGIVLGEMTYRLSNQIVNNRTRGFKRQISEVMALMVNPMNGFNRVLNGRWGKVDRNTPERDSTHVLAEFDLGARKFRADHHGRTGWYGHVRLSYGTPFENYRTPFSNISVNGEFGSDDSSKVNILFVYGSLAGWWLSKAERDPQLLTLSANYDYVHNEAFFYSGQSVKLNWLASFRINKYVQLTSGAGAGPVLLAAVPDPYLFKGRNYDYGAGGGMYGQFGLNLLHRLSYHLNYRGGWIRTINGNASHYVLQAVTSELAYRFWDGLALCSEFGYFHLRGDYQKYPAVTARYPYLRFSVRYTLDFN